MGGIGFGNIAWLGSSGSANNYALAFFNGAYANAADSGDSTPPVPRMGLDWQINFRFRLGGSHGYMWRIPTSYLDAFCFYQYGNGTLALFSADNFGGADPALYFSTPVTDQLYHEVELVYAAGVLTASLDGAPAGSRNMAGFEPKGGPLVFAERSGDVRWAGTIDFYKIRIGSSWVVDYQMNNPSGNPKNAGTLGGELYYYSDSSGYPALPQYELVA